MHTNHRRGDGFTAREYRKHGMPKNTPGVKAVTNRYERRQARRAVRRAVA